MTTTTRLYTAEDFWRLSRDDVRRELVSGEIKMRAPAGGEHGDFGLNIGAMLRAAVRARKLGRAYGADTGFIISRNPDTVLAPDAAFVRSGRLPGGKSPKTFIPLAPDLAVEVLSPGDSVAKAKRKIDQYLAAGTQIVWLVRPARGTVTVYEKNQKPRDVGIGETLTAGDVIPGFCVAVAEIFE